MSSVSIEKPRSPRASGNKRSRNLEKWGWIYMRASGVVLVVLIFGHLLVNLYVGDGVNAIDFAFVAGKWADPFWVVWDTLLLWLALIHGANGMRTIINDYASNVPLMRVFGRTFSLSALFKGALLVSTIVLLLLGSLVIFTFDPCPTVGDQSLLPSFCGTR